MSGLTDRLRDRPRMLYTREQLDAMCDVIDAADAALVGPDASEQQAIERSDALVDALARFREVAQ